MKECYGHKQMLIFSDMDSFMQLSVVKTFNNVSNFQKLYNKIEIIVRNLGHCSLKGQSLFSASIYKNMMNNYT